MVRRLITPSLCAEKASASCVDVQDCAQARLNAVLVQPCSLHMQYVEEIENAYWAEKFSLQPYYVAGRSYDQYQPAFELGWRTALKAPDASFLAFEGRLESTWSSQKNSSLLTWREVRSAVQDAWVHALGQLEHMQQKRKGETAVCESSAVLKPLYSKSLNLIDQLHQLGGLHDAGFVREVIDRHKNLLQEQALELSPYLGTKPASTSRSVMRLTGRWSQHWANIKLAFENPEVAHLFVLCERGEWQLVKAYEKALKEALPENLDLLLTQHLKHLKINADKLAWVRKNWLP